MINGPVRKSLGTAISGGFMTQAYRYRTGDFGLIHPLITDFWKDFHTNYSGKIRTSFLATNMGALDLGVYIHEKEDIPVLLYNGNLLNCGSSEFMQKKKEYFIASLRKNEFVEVKGKGFEEVKKELFRLYEENEIRVFSYPADAESPEKALEKTIKEQWGKLSLFNPDKNLIHEIPIEVSRRIIPQERIKREEQLKRDLTELEKWRRKSERSDFIFDYTV